MGYSMYYLPRKLQNLDPIFGEDNISKFDVAIPIEMYYENSDGWQGAGNILSRFGVEINNEMTFTLSKTRWETEIAPHASNLLVPQRPQEGDLIWEPLSGSLLEITYVDRDKQFYPLSKFYSYKLKCAFFQYSQEKITTGVTEIDSNVPLSRDLFEHQMLLEDGFLLLQEDGYSLFLDTDLIDPERKVGNDTDFTQQAEDINWDVNNPFGDK